MVTPDLVQKGTRLVLMKVPLLRDKDCISDTTQTYIFKYFVHVKATIRVILLQIQIGKQSSLFTHTTDVKVMVPAQVGTSSGAANQLQTVQSSIHCLAQGHNSQGIALL